MSAKTTLASAVAAAIAVSAVGIQSAQATTLFFPYVGVGPTVTTVISTINTFEYDLQDLDPNYSITNLGPAIHYRLYFKPAGDASRETPCDEVDLKLPTSANDIQTFDIGGHFGAETKGVLFNDPGAAVPYMKGPTYSLAQVPTAALGGAMRGYLLVDNGDAVADRTTLAGEAFLYDFNLGAVWGYQALAANGPLQPAGNFGTGGNFNAWASANNTMIPIMPLDEVTTALFVTPVSSHQAPIKPNKYVARVSLGVDTDRWVFDRDETPVSSGGTRDVTCVGKVIVADLLPLSDQLRNGGWSMVNNSRIGSTGPGTTGEVVVTSNGNEPAEVLAAVNPAAVPPVAPAPGAVIIKLDYSAVPDGTFDGVPVGGVYNNGYRLQEAPAIMP